MSNYYGENPKRVAEPVDDDCEVEKIEVEFAIPVFITQRQQRQLSTILEEICRAPVNTPVGGVHWMAGHGSKPNFNRRDLSFLYKPDDPNAPPEGEPTFDDTIYHFESCARPLTETERLRSGE